MLFGTMVAIRGTSRKLGPVLHGGPIALPRGVALVPLATASTLLSAAISFVWPLAITLLLGCIGVSIAIRLHFHDAMSGRASALGSLMDLLVAARRLSNVGSVVLSPELSSLARALARIEGYRAAVSWGALDLPRMNELAASIIMYLNVFLLLDVLAFVRSVRLVREHGATLASLFDIVGEIDAARSIASYRAGTGACTPTFTGRGSPVAIAGMVHPLLGRAVPNDVHLESSQGWLIMGSNMAGKSTCLRALALSACLAQSIGCVTAASYSAPMLRIRTLLYVEDDVLAGKSHFLAEAQAARDMLLEGAAGHDRLCIVDELFRGTNTADRVAAGSAFLRALARDGAFVVAASHDTELIVLLGGTFRPHYFQETIEGAALTFDYRLREGAMAPRNALAVLELVGFPAEVLAEARAGRG